ncbi:MAG: T9SS type A sorting domain-containing protein [Schleiferiaceae bacterium]|nr:T9SS type A sorting domain-containing protein [Schleiferiaceae bacterium]
MVSKVIAFLLFVFCSISIAQPGSNDSSFNTLDDGTFRNVTGFNNLSYVSIIQPDEKIIVGGVFSRYNGAQRNRIARLHPNGALDISFSVGSGFNEHVRTLALQTDGKVIVGGDFSRYNGTNVNGLVRLQATGARDQTFDIGDGSNNKVRTVAVQNDGKVLVGGEFTSFNSSIANRIVRLENDGSIDLNFAAGTGFNGPVYDIKIQQDGKILVAGAFTNFNGVIRNNIIRLNQNGTLDSTFNPNANFNVKVNSLCLQPDGKIIAAGDFTTFNGVTRNRIARLQANGNLDFTFNPHLGFSGEVFSISQQSDGKILAGGFFASFNNFSSSMIARLHNNGGFDTTFNAGLGLNNVVYSTTIRNDDKICLGGSFSLYDGFSRNKFVQLNEDGTVDFDFNPHPGANNTVNAFLVQPDQKLIVLGDFTVFNGYPRNHITRLHVDGSLDSSFNLGTGATASIRCGALQQDGKILIGGNFTFYSGYRSGRLARLNTDGTPDTTFVVSFGFNSTVMAVAVQPDGKILVGGNFSSFNTQPVHRIVRLNTDGSLDPTFQFGPAINMLIDNILIQPDNKIVVASSSFSTSSPNGNRILRLETNGDLDPSFDMGSGFNSSVRAVKLQADGKFVVGGNFTSFNGLPRKRVARIHANGSLDSLFFIGADISNTVYDLEIQADGKIVAVGAFVEVNNDTTNFITRLNPNGTVDPTFQTGTGFNQKVTTVAIQQDERILCGGLFTFFNGFHRNKVARLFSCDHGIRIDSVIACKAFTWVNGVTYTSNNTTAVYTLPGSTAGNCDSLLQLHLTIENVSDVTVSQINNTITANNAAATTFQWLDCNNNYAPIPNATNQVFTATQLGSYAVEITENNCVDTSKCVLVSFISASTLPQKVVLFYPNPTKGKISLDFGNSYATRTILVRNFIGQEVLREVFGATSQIEISLTNLPNGPYLIEVADNNQVSVIKVVKN